MENLTFEDVQGIVRAQDSRLIIDAEDPAGTFQCAPPILIMGKASDRPYTILTIDVDGPRPQEFLVKDLGWMKFQNFKLT